MYGDIIPLADQTLLVEGLEPTTVLRQPDIASSVLHRAGDTLFIMDTGATRFFRQRIRMAAERLRPFDRVVLLNSHAHADHTPNNAVLAEISAARKEHHLSAVGLPWLDYTAWTMNGFRALGEYVNLEAAPGFPIGLLFRPFRPLRLLAPRLIDETLAGCITARVLSKFAPLEPSPDTIVPFEDLDLTDRRIGDVVLHGWDFDGAVFAFESRGHSPDSVSFLLPRVKVLFLADETTDYLNLWADTSSTRIRMTLQASLALYHQGAVEVLVGGHQQAPFRGAAIPALLQRLLDDHDVFVEQLRDIVRSHPAGVTVPRIYTELRRRRSIPAIGRYLRLEFPKMPTMLTANITYALLEAGYMAEGPRGRKRFGDSRGAY